MKINVAHTIGQLNLWFFIFGIHYKVIIYFVQLIIFDGHHNFVNGEPIVGHNVRPAQLREFPSAVCIVINDPQINLTNSIICTGTLITNNIVLTAEHCFTTIGDAGVIVKYGSSDLRIARSRHIMWWITYQQWILYKNKRSRYIENDIAAFKLTRDIPDDIIPSDVTNLPNRKLYGERLVIAGWGITNIGHWPFILQTAGVKVIKHTECEARASRLDGQRIVITHSELCSIAEPFVHLELGDSGGPLLQDNILVGINVGNCPNLGRNLHPEQANLHSSIYFYREFITSIKTEYTSVS